ncbi:MAG: 1,4-dihydroxy-2-naphthoate octaprenyltransferase [Bacteroidales bacterium]|nr:1,4-dihydroxy-2-naphthoate octaprenyltransferase [Bacteroidales bacterium]
MSKHVNSAFLSLLYSMRLRTLPLSLSGVLLGLFFAIRDVACGVGECIFLLLTAVSLQILSNLSNELGDFLSGTDCGERNGPAYSLQSNQLSVNVMRKAILITAIISVFCGMAMIWFSFGTLLAAEPIALLCLGAAAIWAAVRYTLGKNPYGYRGFGDIFVFIFFGLVSVCGSYFVLTHELPPLLLLPASAVGLFSVGVLNVNNLRDMDSDRATRVTIPLKIGGRQAKIYHCCLIAAGWICMIVYVFITHTSLWNYLFILTLPLYIKQVAGVWTRTGRELDKMLPLLVMSTMFFCILAGVGVLL